MLVKPPPEQLTMWKFAGFFGSKGSADIGPNQGRGLDARPLCGPAIAVPRDSRQLQRRRHQRRRQATIGFLLRG